MSARYTIYYIINGHERRKAGPHQVMYERDSASESYILSEFQRFGRVPRVDGSNIRSLMVERIERS
jgi:hypothetical protein